ncbi:MAG: TSUP family transporter, partial [Actinomycetota bacterium]
AGAALAQTVTGFGFSLLAVPPLTLVLDPADAVAVALVLLVPANILVVAPERADIDRVAAGWLLAGSAVGLPIGLVALRALSADGLRLAVAIAVLGAVVVVVTGWPTVGHGAPTLAAAGVVAGALTTSLTTNGPPAAIALQGRGLRPNSFRPTIGVVIGSTAAVGVVLFAGEGRLGGEVPAAAAVGLPAQLLGWAVGLRLRGRVPDRWSRLAVIGLLVLGAVVSAVAALR